MKVSNFYLNNVIANEESNLEHNIITDDISQLGRMLLVLFKGDWEGLDFSNLPLEFNMFLLECNSKSSTVDQLLEHAFIKQTDLQVNHLITTDPTLTRDMNMISIGEFEDLEEECTSAVQEEFVEDDDFEDSGEDDEDDQEQSSDKFFVSFATDENFKHCDNDSTVDKCSRLETDFEILELLGKGGCGRIIKVQTALTEDTTLSK